MKKKDTDKDRASMPIIQIAVPVPLKGGQVCAYDYYAGPATGKPRGTIVKIPLGSRYVWGIVLKPAQLDQPDIQPNITPHHKLKTVCACASVPPLDEVVLKFLHQVTTWTLAPFGAVMKLMLNTPDALEEAAMQIVYRRADRPAPPQNCTPQRQCVLDFLHGKPPLPIKQITQETGISSAVIKRMVAADLLVAETQARQPENWDHTALMVQNQNRLTLSPAQHAIAEKIRDRANGFSIHVLDGVTGSGKTEIYFTHVAEHAARAQQILILLPEIALTTSWQDRFQHWFGFRPMVWHSSISPAKRRDYWRQAIMGEPMIMVGARSALFLPFTNLGLIVVDEEHDASFKQEEYVRYHARDMAILRAKTTQIPIILASATPSLESWVHAGGEGDTRTPYWHHHVLEARFGTARLPRLNLIDLRQHRPTLGPRSDITSGPRSDTTSGPTSSTRSGQYLSAPLITALGARLEAGEQSLLFLNRRGYAPMAVCRECGHRLSCHQCDVLLVTHRRAGKLQCHICGHNQPISLDCPACAHKSSMITIGPGVERLSEEVKTLYPHAKIAIMSSDMIKSSMQAEQFFTAVQAGEIDIIIGTQMAAKGHHFPLLTLVGVVDADLGLGGGDLRASERTYQLLWQVAGRSGRGDRPGEVFIQTFQPQHPVLHALSTADPNHPIAARDRFLQAEAAARRDAGMPPFGRLAAIILSGSDLESVQNAAHRLYQLRPQFAHVDIYGPAPAALRRAKGAYRYRFLIRTDRQVALQKILSDWLDKFRPPTKIRSAKIRSAKVRSAKVRVVCDIDPYSFL